MDKLTMIGKMTRILPDAIKNRLTKLVFADTPESLPNLSAHPNLTVALVLGGCNGRVERAAKLYHKGIVTKILVSGGIGEYSENKEIPEAIINRQKLLDLGVADEDIWVEENSRTTMENLEFSLPIITYRCGLAQRCNVVLITNHFHLRRAKLYFLQVVEELKRVTGNVEYGYLHLYWSTADFYIDKLNWRHSLDGCMLVGKEAIQLVLAHWHLGYG